MSKRIMIVSKYSQIYSIELKFGGDFKIISVTNQTGALNADREIESVYRYINLIDVDSVLKKILLIIKNISSVQYDGKTIKELVSFRNISTWWFLRTDLYTYLYKNAIQIELIKKMLANEAPAEIFLTSDNEFIDLIKEVVPKQIRIVTIDFEPRSNIFQMISGQISNNIKSFKENSLTVRRAMAGIFRYFLLNKRAKYLIITRSHEWQTIRTGKGDIKGDIHFWDIIKNLEKSKNNFMLIDLPKTYDAAKLTLKEKKYPYVYWEAFIALNLLSPKSFRELKSFRKNIRKLQISLMKKIRPVLKYDDIDIGYCAIPRLDQYFSSKRSSFYSAARNISIADGILSKFGIKVTITTEENTACRSFIASSIQRGIKTIGMQHGSINIHSIAYRYDKDELSAMPSLNSAPICDMTAVYGQYYKNILVRECNYNPSGLEVTGQPRADSMAFYDSKKDKENVLCSLKIKKKKNIILFITQPFQIEKQKEQVLRDVLSTAKQIIDFHLIVKLHPGESPELVKKIADEVGIEISVVKNVNLYEYLSACSIVITPYSTVITEALLFGKPVLVLGYLGKNYDPSGYRATNSVIFADDPAEIKDKIFEGLKDIKTIRLLHNSRKRFVSERNFRLDGKSSLRVLGLMERMAGEPTRK